MHGLRTVVEIIVVGLGIHVLLHALHVAQVLDVVRIGKRQSVFGIGKVAQNELPHLFRLVGISIADIHQIHVVVHIQTIDIVGIAFQQFVERIFSRSHVFQFVFQDNAHIEQTFLHHIVRSLYFLLRLRNLHQVVLRIVRVLFTRQFFFRLFHLGYLLIGKRITQRVGHDGFFLLFVVGFFEIRHGESCLVRASPVVFQLTAAPHFLELCLTGIFRSCIIEIPRLVGVERIGGSVALQLVSGGILLCQIFLAAGFLSRFPFLFLQFFRQSFRHFPLLFRCEFCQFEQGVLQRNVLRIYGQFVKHIGTTFQHGVVGIIVGQLRHGFRIARLCLVVFETVEIQSTEGYRVDGLVNAVARTFFVGQHIIVNRLQRVAAREIQVTDGIVHLVEIVLVAVLPRHPFQRLHLRLDVRAHIYLALLDAGIEFRAVGSVRGIGHFLESLIGFRLHTVLLLKLPEQEAHTCFLHTSGGIYCLRQIGNGILSAVSLNEIVGIRHIVHSTQFLGSQFFGFQPGSHILRLVCPTQGTIGAQLPDFRLGHQFGQPVEIAFHIAECGSGSEKIAVQILGFAHQPPGIVEKWIIFAAFQIFAVFRVTHLAAVLFRLLLNGMQGNGLLHLFQCAVKIGRRLCCLRIGMRFGRMDKQKV